MFFDAMQNYMVSFCCTWFQVLHGLAVGQLQLFPSFSTRENKISGCNFEFLGTKAYYLQAEKRFQDVILSVPELNLLSIQFYNVCSFCIYSLELFC